ncbi:MAG TPA: DciA family protein [Steroidobacteraceae bacterium]|nr:DciA family protein [Steroidobacteraceae bacterium]
MKTRKPTAVSELLAQGKAKLERLKRGADAATEALAAVQHALPTEAAGHVWGASLAEEGVLTLVIDSGGWASRLRYALPELAPRVSTALGKRVARVIVRVRPRPRPR